MRLPTEISARNQTIDHFIVSFAFFILESSHVLNTSFSDPTTIYITATRERRIEIFTIHLERNVFNPFSTQRLSTVVIIVVLGPEKQEEREVEISVQKVQEAKLVLNINKEERIISTDKINFFIAIN